MDPALLASALERSPVGADGRSGALLERLLLPDGRRVVVKRFDPAGDLVMRLTGDEHGREVEFFRRGLLEALPPSVGHAVLGGWYDDEGRGVLVMRDLGDAVFTWHDRLGAREARVVLAAVADLHAAYRGDPPAGLTPLAEVVGLFEPRRIRPYAGETLVDYALRGWEYWPEVAPGEVGDRVLALALDSAPLVAALERCPATFLHGDLATVNMGLEPDRPGMLTLIDWGIAAAGPGELDVGRLLAGCGHLFEPGLDDLVDVYRVAAGPSYDEGVLRLGLLAGLVWLGWNKALDIVEHPKPAVRAREESNLRWWLHQAALALETGVL